MHPYLIRLPGGWGVPSYGTMLGLGFVVGYFVAKRHARDEGMKVEILADLWVFSILGGIIGARLWSAFITGDPLWSIFVFWKAGGIRGLVFYGGFIGAVLTTVVYLRWRKEPLLRSYDAITPSMALGLAFGRVGCLLAGCCWGRECNLPWAVRFPGKIIEQSDGYYAMGSPAFKEHFAAGRLPMDATWSNPVHPAQVYGIIAALCVFAILQWFYKRKKHDGEILWVFLALYGIARFILEHFRANVESNSPKSIHGISPAQLASIIAVVTGLCLFVGGRLLRGDAKPSVATRPESTPRKANPDDSQNKKPKP